MTPRRKRVTCPVLDDTAIEMQFAATLMAAAFGKNATCVIGPDRLGDCMVEGKPLAVALHQPEIVDAAYAWR